MSTPTLPYIAEQCRVYYAIESSFGQFNGTETMNGINAFQVDPYYTPNLIKVKTLGTPGYSTLAKGMREGRLRIGYYLPSGTNAWLLLRRLLEVQNLTYEVLYYVGDWSNPSSIISLLFNGCRADKVTIEAEAAPEGDDKALLRVTADLICQKLTVGSAKASTGTYQEQTGVIPFHDLNVYFKVGGSQLSSITKFKIGYSANLKAVPTIRSTDADLMRYLRHTGQLYEAECEFEFESGQRWSDAVNFTEQTLEFGLGYQGFYLTLNGCRIEEITNPTKVGNDIVFMRVKWVSKNGVLTYPT
jgi:hypothetical protein